MKAPPSDMRRITIMGAAAAGKSTLATALGDRLGLRVVHLDHLLWLSGWVQRPKDEFLPLVEEAIAGDAWVMDGNYSSTLDMRLARTDTVIVLTSPTWRSLLGIFARWWEFRGRTRPSMTEGCPEHVDFEFVWWVLTYNRRRLPELLAKARAALPPDRIVILRDKDEINRFVAAVDATVSA